MKNDRAFAALRGLSECAQIRIAAAADMPRAFSAGAARVVALLSTGGDPKAPDELDERAMAGAFFGGLAAAADVSGLSSEREALLTRIEDHFWSQLDEHGPDEQAEEEPEPAPAPPAKKAKK